LAFPTRRSSDLLGLSGRIRKHCSDKTIEAQFDAGCCLLRVFHISEPAESKVGIVHSDSFFSCVRICVFPLAKISVSSWEKRSRSCRILVTPSSSSSQWSVNFTERQWAM